MNTANFPVIMLTLFLALAIFTPLVLFVFLDKSRALAVEISDKEFRSLFIGEIFLWFGITLVAGFILTIILSLFVFSSAIAKVRENMPVRLIPQLLVFGTIGIQILLGFWIHKNTEEKLNKFSN